MTSPAPRSAISPLPAPDPSALCELAGELLQVANRHYARRCQPSAVTELIEALALAVGAVVAGGAASAGMRRARFLRALENNLATARVWAQALARREEKR